MADGATDVRAGFEEEALPHLDSVYRFALQLSGSPDQAQDLVQETYLRAYRSWDQYTRGTAARSWLFTICRNDFLRRERRRKRHREIVEEHGKSSARAEGSMWRATAGPDPEHTFFDSLVDQEVDAAIRALPTYYRTVVTLVDVEGLRYTEVADRMDVPEGTVKSRLFRARRLLRDLLHDYAVETGYVPHRRCATR